MIRSTLLDVLRAYRRQWWRFLLTEVLVAVAVGAVIAVLAVLTQLGFVASGSAITTAAGYLRPGAVVVASALITVMFALTGLPALMASITALVSITDDTLSGRPVRLFRSLAIGFASAYRMTWTVLVAVLSVGLLFVVSPALLVLGVLGLIVTPLVRLAGRRFPRLAARWPSVRSLVWCVVPFGVAFRRLAQSLLAVPAVILESVGPVGAHRAAAAAVRSRRLLVLLGFLAATLVAAVLTIGALSLGGIIAGDSGGQVAEGIVELFTLGLPIVVLTVIYRRIADERDQPLNPQRFVRRRIETSIAWPAWVRRTATVMPGVLLLAGVSVVPLSVSSASAATSDVSASYMVNSAADDVDATTLAAEQANCESGSGDCTFRAAIAEAQATAVANPDSRGGSIAITFSKSMTIDLDPSASPTFALTTSQSSGTLSIDGRGHNVVIDGQGAVQGLTLSSAFWGFDLRGLEFDNGYAPSGTGNLSQGGALHLLVQDPATTSLIDGVTFSGNEAVGGGALFSNATVTVRNSTFLHNALLAADSVVHSGGADISASGDMTATNDTFSNSTGGTLYGSGTFALTNALMDENDIHTSRCTGITSGSHNIISTDDFTCAGGASSTNVFGTKSMLDTLVTPDGYPSVFPLLVNTDNPALGAGTNCPATDERGLARATATCDAGAYELDRNTTVKLDSTNNPSSVATAVTFTATVSSTAASGGVSGGSVRFSIDGTAVGSAVQVTDGAAQYSSSNLAVGTHKVIAVFTPANGSPFTPATSAALQQEVDKATGPIGISANESRAILGDAVTFTFAAGDTATPATGTFDLRDVTDGAPGDVVASDVAFDSAGTASVDVDTLSTGVHKLLATYSGDAQNASGTSATITLTVVAPTTTTLDLDRSSIAYGTPVVATAHVAGTTSAHPSGDVDFVYGTSSGAKDVAAKVDADGNATATLPDLPVGSPTVTAVYESTGSYQGSSSAPATVTVAAASTSTSLSTGQVGDLGYGVPVTLTATVMTTATGSTADPSGAVTFTLGGTTIGTGTLVGNANGTATATYTTTLGQLPIGTANLAAAYSASSSFVDSASTTVSRTIVAADTTVTVSSDGADAPVGHTVQLRATVAATGSAAVPTGSVDFTEDGTELGTASLVNGVATLGIATLARGSHTITVTYAGTAKADGSIGTFVQKISRATTTTALTTSSSSVVFGKPVDLDVVVTASGGNLLDGTVIVTDGTDTVATLLVTAGRAHGTLSALGAGHHDLTASFVAGDDYAASSGTADVTVTAATTTTSLAQSASTVVYGDALVLTATVASSTGSGATPAGSVEFRADGKLLATVAVAAGSAAGTATAALTTRDLDVSSDVLLTAEFVPSDDFVASQSDAAHVAITPATTTTSLVLTAGSTTKAVTATATVVAATGQGVPTGSITFTYPNGKDDSVKLIDGVATLSVRLPSGFDNVTATYHPDSADFTAGDAATRSVSIEAGAPDVTIIDNAMGDFTYGTSDTLTAVVAVNSAGPTPTGDISFIAYGSGSPTVLGTVAVTPFSATGYGYASRGQLTTTSIPAGTTRIVATYQGDDNYDIGTSADLDRTVSTASTTATVTSSLGEPAWVGADDDYYVTLSTSTGATPTGTVLLTLDGIPMATKTLSYGRADFAIGREALGTHHVVAIFTPADSNFAASTAELDHLVVKVPTTLELNAIPGVVGVGERIPLTVILTPASGFAKYTSAPAGGFVVVTENGQPVCSMNLSPGGPVAGDETGTCSPTYAHVGTHTFVATYSGGNDYQSSVSRDTLAFVQKKTATAALAAPAGDWIGGNTVRLDWQVSGPSSDDAPVTISYGDVVVCSSEARAGSCDYTFAANTTGIASFSLTYAGDADWNGATASLNRTVTGCIPASDPTADPAVAGTALVQTFPNCYSGGWTQGYLVGTTVSYVAKANDGYHFTYWDPSGDRSTTTSLVVDTSMKTVTDTARFAASCVTVTVSTNSRDLAGGSVTSDPKPNCGGMTSYWASPYGDPTTFIGSFEAGTAVKLTAVPPTTKTTRVQDFYGWKGLPDGANDSTATTSFTIEAATTYKFGATFDTACYTDVTFATPNGGTSSIGKGDCYTPAGVAGFRAGSKVAVSTKATGTGYFKYFTGADVTSVSSSATSATGQLAISSDHLRLGAEYGVCYNAPLVVKGEHTSGTETPSGNCPSQGAGWYTPGTQVHLVASSDVRYNGMYQFGGWTGLPVEGSFGDTFAVVNASGQFTASYYSINGCVPLKIVSEPAGAFSIAVTRDTTTGVEDTCPAGEWDTNQSFDGHDNHTSTRAHIVATPLTAAAKTAVGVMGVDTTRVDQNDLSSAYSIRPTRSLDQYVDIDGATTITASACESINATVTLISPNGSAHTEPNPGDADFIDVAPTPTCNYGQTYYTVGDPVFTQANAPADGYDFVKWTGAITSTDPDPATPVKVDGSAEGVSLTATYNVKCYALTSNWDGVSAFPAPNCPDTDASAHKYIGGTTVALSATGVSHQIFRNWTGPANSTSGDTAVVTMTSAKAVYAYYSTPSAGEALTSAFTSVGDGLAMAAKKAVGVVSSVVTALVMNSNPVTQIISLVAAAASGVSALLHAVGVSGSALDGFDDGLSYVTGMLTFITAVSNCATIWSYGADGPTPGSANVSSAVGSGIVKEIRVQQAAQQAAIDAAYDAPSGISGVATSTVTKAKVTVGRLATAATVGVSIYSEIANNNSWSEDATTAWTGGGDAYLRCIDDSIPSYMGVPALPPGN